MTLSAYVAKSGPISKGCKNEDIVKEAQADLRKAGHELDVDGDFGGVTASAVQKYQAAHGLQATGYIGPKTAAALDAQQQLVVDPVPPLPSVITTAPWLSVMRALTGIHEGVAAKDNPIILSWPREIADKFPDLGPDVLWYNHDSIPWCGLCCGIAVTRAGEKPPAGLLGAGNWAEFGRSMKLSQRTPGAIFVYSRTGGHHVTMYESEDAGSYYCRGGNQSDQINVIRIPKSRPVVAVRWGLNFPIPSTGPKQGATPNYVSGGSEA